MLARITSLTALSGSRLSLGFADGSSGTLDLAPLIARGGVFARLADPAEFAKAAIGPSGRSVEWPGEIDLCADALRLAIDRGTYLLAS